MPPRPENLRAAIAGGDAALIGPGRGVALAEMGRALDADLSGANVLLRTASQLFAALALIELDGVAARIVICPPDVKPEHLPDVIERAAIDVVVSDDPALAVEDVRFEQLHLPKQTQACPSLVGEAHPKGEVVSACEGDHLGAERKLKPEGVHFRSVSMNSRIHAAYWPNRPPTAPHSAPTITP